MDPSASIASDSAWAQRSLTGAPHWQRLSAGFVRGGALQRPARVPALPGPPARILAQSQSEGALRSDCAGARRRQPSTSETGATPPLRERLRLELGIPKEAKVQLLRRLDELDRGIPPYLRRPPSWLPQDAERPAAATDGALADAPDATQLQASVQTTTTITTITATESSDDGLRCGRRGSRRSRAARFSRQHAAVALVGRRGALRPSRSAAELGDPSAVERVPSRGLQSKLRRSLREAMA